jgi:hypothetical protein
MRENRPYGSEGGVGAADPDPYHTPHSVAMAFGLASAALRRPGMTLLRIDALMEDRSHLARTY